jgi:hypothetical protein
VAGTLRRMADRDDREAPSVERVGRVGHLDHFGLGRWVLEGGIKLLSRSTRWIMLTFGSCFGSGYGTGYCSG